MACQATRCAVAPLGHHAVSLGEAVRGRTAIIRQAERAEDVDLAECERFGQSEAHVGARQAPYYAHWVREAYHLADAALGAELGRADEERALLRLVAGEWAGVLA